MPMWARIFFLYVFTAMLASSCGGDVEGNASTAPTSGGGRYTTFVPSSTGGNIAAGGNQSVNSGIEPLSATQLASIEANVCTWGDANVRVDVDAGLLSCHFPSPNTGSNCNGGLATATANDMSIVYTTGTGQILLIHFSSDPTCPGGDGYYFNDPTQTELALCPNTCKTVQQDASAIVQILSKCDGPVCAR